VVKKYCLWPLKNNDLKKSILKKAKKNCANARYAEAGKKGANDWSIVDRLHSDVDRDSHNRLLFETFRLSPPSARNS
jgi:hypothetical protein